MCLQQHQRAALVSLKVGDCYASGTGKKFKVVRQLGGNKFEIYDLLLNAYETVHANRLK